MCAGERCLRIHFARSQCACRLSPSLPTGVPSISQFPPSLRRAPRCPCPSHPNPHVCSPFVLSGPQTLVADVLPFALQKCGDDESVDSRVVAANVLGGLASRLEKETVETRFLARALAMCQARPQARPAHTAVPTPVPLPPRLLPLDTPLSPFHRLRPQDTDGSVRKAMARNLGRIARGTNPEVSQDKVLRELAELATDEEARRRETQTRAPPAVRAARAVPLCLAVRNAYPPCARGESYHMKSRLRS